jgi:cbb3-type cytochrome oxidase subunit 3
LVSQNDWFGANSYWQGASIVLLVYFAISFVVCVWFYNRHRKEDAGILALA